MGFFSGILDTVKDVVGGVTNFVSDNLPAVADVASSFFGGPSIPLMGGTDEEMTSGPFTGGGDSSWWPGLKDVIGGISSAGQALSGFSPFVAGLASYQGANSANEANERMFNTGLSWQEWQAQKNRDFSGLEASRNRDWQAWQASANRDFAERMSNTSWQRGVADMKAAGINPMLAFSRGGASSPTSSSGPGAQGQGSPGGYSLSRLENALGAGVNSALAAAQNAALVDKIKAETDRTNMETSLISAQIPRTRQETLTSSSAEELNRVTAGNRALEYNKMLKEIDLLAESIEVRKQDVLIAKENVRNAMLTGKNIEANTSNTQMNTLLNSLDEQHKRNLMEAEKTPWKRNVSPYLGDVNRITSSAADVARIVGR